MNMKNLKMYASLLLSMVLCLSLAACGNSKGSSKGNNNGGKDDNPNVGGSDWRTTGIWRDCGTITRDGEDTDVLVCIHKADATFYYDTESQIFYDSVDYPIALEGDAWEMYQSIDFSDLNGDGDSDVTIRFNDGSNEMLMVWYWDTKSLEYVYQSEKSNLGKYNDGRGDLVPNNGGSNNVGHTDGYYSWDSELCQRNVSEFEGVWYFNEDLSATSYIIIDGSGNWSYYERTPGDAEGTEMDHGTFSYSADEVSTYYADSAVYDNLSIRVFEFDDGIITWGEDTFYRME